MTRIITTIKIYSLLPSPHQDLMQNSLLPSPHQDLMQNGPWMWLGVFLLHLWMMQQYKLIEKLQLSFLSMSFIKDE